MSGDFGGDRKKEGAAVVGPAAPARAQEGGVKKESERQRLMILTLTSAVC